MAAVDVCIADLLANKTSQLAQPLICKVDDMVAALQQLSAGSNAISLQGRAVAATAPIDGQVLTWVTADNSWEPKSSASNPFYGQFAPPLAATFPTIINGNGDTPAPAVSDQSYGMRFNSGVSAQVVNSVKGAFKNVINNAAFTVTAQLAITDYPANNGNGIGLMLTDGTKFLGITCAQGDVVRIDEWTNLTTHSGTATTFTDYHMGDEPIWLRWRLSGGNLFAGWSFDGRNFVEFFTQAANTFLGPITQYGIGGDMKSGLAGAIGTGPFFISVPNWIESNP